MLHGLLTKIWEQECIPSDWKKGILVKIPKKDDLSLRKNYRGVMLLPTAGKVLSRIILDRMRDALDERVSHPQGQPQIK